MSVRNAGPPLQPVMDVDVRRIISVCLPRGFNDIHFGAALSFKLNRQFQRLIVTNAIVHFKGFHY